MAASGRFSVPDVKITAIHSNTDQALIIITEDKLRLALNEQLALVANRRAWITPLGLELTLVSVFVTADFHDTLRVSAARWEAIYGAAALLGGIWLVAALIKLRQSRSVGDTIERIKNMSSTK